ncbi:MAG: MMPL family transporter, partial [Actinobacteria bacterium]|nr:MMPL family transporter [Actinomycetota bacterium]
ALRRAGPAIIASAVTVAGGMVYLLVAGSASVAGLAAVAATGIVAGLLAMITLLPALLVLPARWPTGGRQNAAGTSTAPAASTSLSMGGVTLAERAMASGHDGPAAPLRRADAAATSENSANIKVPVG